MVKNKLTKGDITHLRDEARAMRADEEGMSAGGATEVMTSIGYVALYTDGDVVAHGYVIGKFDEDLDYTDDEE